MNRVRTARSPGEAKKSNDDLILGVGRAVSPESAPIFSVVLAAAVRQAGGRGEIRPIVPMFQHVGWRRIIEWCERENRPSARVISDEARKQPGAADPLAVRVHELWHLPVKEEHVGVNGTLIFLSLERGAVMDRLKTERSATRTFLGEPDSTKRERHISIGWVVADPSESLEAFRARLDMLDEEGTKLVHALGGVISLEGVDLITRGSTRELTDTVEAGMRIVGHELPNDWR